MSPMFDLPTLTQSTCIFCDKRIVVSCAVKIYYSGGAIRFFFGLSNEPTTAPLVWEEVESLVSGVEQTHTFANSGKALFYRIVKDYDTIIATQIDGNGRKTYPALQVTAFTTV